MKHREIEAIIKKRFEKLNTAFNQVGLHYEENDIRLFRVKVKKLQACLLLMECEKNHHKAIVLPSKIAKFYKVSGAIRAIQLQEIHIRKIKAGANIMLPETYLAILSDKILHLIGKASKLLSTDKPFGKEEVKLLGLLPHHLDTARIDKFIASEGTKLKKLFAPVFPTDISLHEVRKILKALLYISPYLARDIGTLLPYSLLSSTAQIDALTAILGNFHDLNIAIDCLHTECLALDIPEDEKALLRNIECQWIEGRTAMHEKIYDQLTKINASLVPVESLVKWPVM